MSPGDRVHGDTGAACLAFAQQHGDEVGHCSVAAKPWLISTSMAEIMEPEGRCGGTRATDGSYHTLMSQRCTPVSCTIDLTPNHISNQI